MPKEAVIDESLQLSPETKAAIKRYLPYLQEIRKKLLGVGIIFALFGLIGFFFYQKILTFTMGLFNLQGITIVLTSPYQFIDLAINTGIVVGTVATFPLLLYYLIQFIRPALRPYESGIIKYLIPLSLLLFVFGFGFGFWIMNVVIKLFYNTTQDFNLNNLWDISRFFTQTLIMAVSLGVVFQFPIILTALVRFGLVTKKQLIDGRRYIYAGCILFATFMPPTDLLSLTLIVLPLIVFFELTLIFNPVTKTSLKG